MGALAQKVALVTGAGRGIGREVALALAREGVCVAVCARTTEQIEATAKETGGIAVPCDVTSRDSIEEAVRKTESSLGPIDILVNNAGVADRNPIETTSDDMWDRILHTNLRGAFCMTRAVVDSMKARGYGRIVNVASRAGRRGFPYVTAYCASKHGMVGLTRALAIELEGTGVTANAVCPAWVDTDRAREAAETIAKLTGKTVAQACAEMAADNASGKLIPPQRVAAEVLTLCLGNANGQLIDME